MSASEDANNNESGTTDQGDESTKKQQNSPIEQFLTYQETSTFGERLLQAHLNNLTVNASQFVLLISGVLIALMWPVDYLIFFGVQRHGISGEQIMGAFEIWKPVVLLVIFFTWTGLKFSRTVQRNVNLTLVVGLCVAFGAIAYSFARLEDTAGPWFQVMFIIPWTTILLEVKPLRRLVYTILPTLAYALGYAIEFPGYLDHPDAVITSVVTGGLILVSTLFGHIFYHLTRNNFFKDRTLRRNEMQMEHLANYDQLTGLINRRYFEECLTREYQRAERYDTDLSILMLDIDHFKSINDTYGHQTGDTVLAEFGKLIKRDLRSSDLAGRYGGEEFCVVLPETNRSNAMQIAERLREFLKEPVFKSTNGEEFTVSCSMGVSTLDESISDPEELLKMADDALYESKARGRDTVTHVDRMENNNTSDG